jgi:hypothetical protein
MCAHDTKSVQGLFVGGPHISANFAQYCTLFRILLDTHDPPSQERCVASQWLLPACRVDGCPGLAQFPRVAFTKCTTFLFLSRSVLGRPTQTVKILSNCPNTNHQSLNGCCEHTLHNVTQARDAPCAFAHVPRVLAPYMAATIPPVAFSMLLHVVCLADCAQYFLGVCGTPMSRCLYISLFHERHRRQLGTVNIRSF